MPPNIQYMETRALDPLLSMQYWSMGDGFILAMSDDMYTAQVASAFI